VDKQTSTADVGRQIKESNNDILEKTDAQPLAFMVGVDTESGEECDGLGIASSPLAETLRCRSVANLCHAPGIVGNNSQAPSLGCNEDTSRPGTYGLAGIAVQPLGLLR